MLSRLLRCSPGVVVEVDVPVGEPLLDVEQAEVFERVVDVAQAVLPELSGRALAVALACKVHQEMLPFVVVAVVQLVVETLKLVVVVLVLVVFFEVLQLKSGTSVRNHL